MRLNMILALATVMSFACKSSKNDTDEECVPSEEASCEDVNDTDTAESADTENE